MPEGELNENLQDEVQEIETQEQDNIEEESDNTPNEIEEKARAMGWRPLEEFKGDPGKHIPADKYVERGLEKLPILQRNYENVTKELKDVKDQLQATKEYQEHIGKVSYERALKDIQQKQREAVEAGDVETFDKLEKQKEQAKDEYTPKQSEPASRESFDIQRERLELQRSILNWKKENSWYDKDRLLQTEADIILEQSKIENPGLTMSERLDLISREVKQNNPSKFQNTQPAKLPSLSGTKQSSQKVSKSWKDIPDNDREVAESWIKKGILTQEQYVKDYFGD